MISQFFLVNQEERAFSYVRDTLFSVLNLSIDKGLVVVDPFFEYRRIKLYRNLNIFVSRSHAQQANPLCKSFIKEILSKRYGILFSACVLWGIRMCSLEALGPSDINLVEVNNISYVSVIVRKTRFRITYFTYSQ